MSFVFLILKHHALHLICIITMFHTYVLYILYKFLYIDCSGAFLYVSFSLSLVYISCIMAPKRKSTPSQNPLCFGASTSFDPTPSHIQFRDENAKSDFFENFSRRGVHSERQVILSDFSDIDLPTIIYNRD